MPNHLKALLAEIAQITKVDDINVIRWRSPIAGTPLVPPPSRSPSDLDVLIGARLRLARKMRGLSQGGLADILGITFQQIQKYEAGSNRISAVTLFVIADKLAIPITYFYEDFGSAEAGSGEAVFDNHHQRYATTSQGQKLIDAFRACSPDVQRSLLSLMKAARTEDPRKDATDALQ